MKWRNLFRVLACGLALDASALPTYANWLYTPGAGPSAFVSFNSGTTPAGTALCAAANTDCLANVPINTAGAALFVTGNAGLVTGTGGTFPATQSGTWNITNVSGTVSLPTGAATSALQTTGNTALTTINTTLGSPFQAGGSIGNTSFAATQATASSLNATVVGTGTFAVQAAQSGTWNVTNISGTVSLPTGAATSANQTNASQKTQIVDGSGNVIASTSNNLNVQCANCSGSGASAVDAATFTAGTSVFAPSGGQFTTGGATACVTGHQCVVGMTAARGMFTDMSSIAGTTTSTGNGTQGAGTQRVAIASDNTAFSVNATLQASSTTAIGKVDPNTIATWGLATVGAGTAPTNALVVGCIQASPTPSANQSVAVSCDASGNVKVVGVGVTQGSTTSGQTGSLVMGAVTTSAPSYTTAQTSPFSLDTSGNIRVNCTTGCGGGSGGTADADAVAFVAGTTQFTPIGGQYTSGGATACVTGHGCWAGMTADRAIFSNLADVGGSAIALGSTTASASLPVVLASNQTAADPCMFQAKTNVAISTASGTAALVTGVSAKKIYVCSLSLVAPSAVSVSLAEGSSSTCGTSAQAAVIGVATNGTAANGMPLAANGGLTLGNGGGTVAATATNANYLCLFQSGTAQLAGNLTYVQQ